jgi:hypothetical protein
MDNMCVRVLQARWTWLLLIDTQRDKEGKGSWEERHTALLELAVALFYMALLHEKQDRIDEAVVCCKEALRARHEVVPNARDDPDLFHLFVTVVRLHAMIVFVLLKEILDKTKA